MTPGIIDIHSHLGDYPSPGVDAHSDGNEMTNPTTPNVWAEHSVWPQDPGFNTALAGGVTSMLILLFLYIGYMSLHAAIDERTRLVSVVHVSNALGTINRVRELQAAWQTEARRLTLGRGREAALWTRFKAATDAGAAAVAAADGARHHDAG